MPKQPTPQRIERSLVRRSKNPLSVSSTPQQPVNLPGSVNGPYQTSFHVMSIKLRVNF